MPDFAVTLLLTGIIIMAAGGIWGKSFYQKKELLIDELLFTPPPGADMIAPHIKHSLLISVPKSIRTDESGEIRIEYFQGVTHPLLEGINSFLHEKLEVTSRALPNSLRGAFFASTRVDDKKQVTSKLIKDFGARLSSSKFTVAPNDWIVYAKGENTPCYWRWSISCNELGKYSAVIELNEAFRSTFSKWLRKSPQIIFEIEVRSPIGLSLRTATIIKYSAISIGGVTSTIAAFIIGLPYLQNYATNILQQWFP